MALDSFFNLFFYIADTGRLESKLAIEHLPVAESPIARTSCGLNLNRSQIRERSSALVLHSGIAIR